MMITTTTMTTTTRVVTTMTDSGPSSEQLERIAQLRQRRAAQSRALSKKKHVAQGGRIIAVGLGATAMLGIVGVLGYGYTPSPDASTVSSSPAPPAPRRQFVRVVVHRVSASTIAPIETVPVTSVETNEQSIPEQSIPQQSIPEPIVLTANPVVQTVTVQAPAPAQPSSQAQATAAPQTQTASAPQATTSGSN